jgi:glycosyltransferase involved in cell wall biosynthesis
MKIAILGHKRIPSREGGIEIVVEELAKRVVALGHDVTCYNRRGKHTMDGELKVEQTKELDGIRIKSVLTIDRRGLAAVTSSFFASLCVAFGKYDVVHYHAEGPCVFLWIPKLFGKRVVATIHGLDWARDKWKSGFGSKYIKFGEKVAVKYADEIIVLSQSVKQYFRTTYHRETNFIANGVTKPITKPARQITERYGLSKDDYILFLGRIVPEKGVHYLIEAFRNMKTDKKLVIAGGSSDTEEYFEQIKQSAKDDTRIIFTGFVQGELLEELYSNAYVYCLPSDLEGMPLSLLEAMSYGNCCVTSDIPECADVVGDNAIIFPKSDVLIMQNMLQKLCDNQEIVAGYKVVASSYICGKYNWDDVAEETLALYASLSHQTVSKEVQERNEI